MIGTPELLLIAALALLLFGGKKRPELMRGLGQGVNQFKKGLNEPLEDDNKKKSETTESSTDKDKQAE